MATWVVPSPTALKQTGNQTNTKRPRKKKDHEEKGVAEGTSKALTVTWKKRNMKENHAYVARSLTPEPENGIREETNDAKSGSWFRNIQSKIAPCGYCHCVYYGPTWAARHHETRSGRMQVSWISAMLPTFSLSFEKLDIYGYCDVCTCLVSFSVIKIPDTY